MSYLGTGRKFAFRNGCCNIYNIHQEWSIHKVFQALLKYEDSFLSIGTYTCLTFYDQYSTTGLKTFERALSLL